MKGRGGEREGHARGFVCRNAKEGEGEGTGREGLKWRWWRSRWDRRCAAVFLGVGV